MRPAGARLLTMIPRNHRKKSLTPLRALHSAGKTRRSLVMDQETEMQSTQGSRCPTRVAAWHGSFGPLLRDIRVGAACRPLSLQTPVTGKVIHLRHLSAKVGKQL